MMQCPRRKQRRCGPAPPSGCGERASVEELNADIWFGDSTRGDMLLEEARRFGKWPGTRPSAFAPDRAGDSMCTKILSPTPAQRPVATIQHRPWGSLVRADPGNIAPPS